MGEWLNVAFIQSPDLARIEQELISLSTERRRLCVHPAQRTPEAHDPMQYGKGDEVWRWGMAGFHGAPGWTALRTAPYELLMQGHLPLLAQLAARLKVPAFQYNLYDSSTQFLLEADENGRVEMSGFVGSDPVRYWGELPSDDRAEVQFRVIDVTSVTEWAERTMPNARVTVHVYNDAHSEAHRLARLRWLQRSGELRPEPEMTRQTWDVHPAHVVRALATEEKSILPYAGVIDAAITTVFGGANGQHCDNGFLYWTLVCHRPMPVSGFVLYADSPH